MTPWTTYHALKKEYDAREEPYDSRQGPYTEFNRKIMTPFLESRRKTWAFLGGVVLALLVSILLIVVNLVPLKMLPFDNKNEFLVLVDMPRGTTLETTDKVTSDLERYLSTVNEVRDLESYVGVASPVDFNGLVRQYYFRKGSYVADIRVNLVGKEERAFQSHAIVLRIRPDIDKIAKANNANVKIVEVPPGPPVLSTILRKSMASEASYQTHDRASKEGQKTDGVHSGRVDVDDTVEAPQTRYHFVVDKTKAGLNGISEEDVVKSAKIFLGGESPTILHSNTEREPLEINLRLPRDLRSRPEDMGPLRVKASDRLIGAFQ